VETFRLSYVAELREQVKTLMQRLQKWPGAPKDADRGHGEGPTSLRAGARWVLEKAP